MEFWVHNGFNMYPKSRFWVHKEQKSIALEN